jgi:hypothetical protein
MISAIEVRSVSEVSEETFRTTSLVREDLARRLASFARQRLWQSVEPELSPSHPEETGGAPGAWQAELVLSPSHPEQTGGAPRALAGGVGGGLTLTGTSGSEDRQESSLWPGG